LSVPSIEDQQKIADILDSLDRKININNKINAELETLARDIYNYWFVQFDFPDANNRPYKTHGGRMSYDPTIKRDIPANWRVTTIDKVSEIIMGQSPKGESYNQQRRGVPLLNGPADYDSTGSLTERIFTTAPTRMCKKDDMVFCVRATIGNLTYAERDFCLGRGVAAVRPIRADLSELIYYSLLNDIERFKIQAVGSVIVGITKDDLTGSNIIIPDDETLGAFHKAVYPVISTIRKNKLENRSLIEVRDWLLPMLMNGQAKVG
jgi:type I restriction enzyme S subunit